MNYLALDIGAARIGVAVGAVVPFGRGTLDATNEAAVLAQLGTIIQTDGVETIIVGVPATEGNEASSSYMLALAWVEKLKHHFNIPVVTVDEAFSSVAAEQALRQEGIHPRDNKGAIDERAAMMLLEQYVTEQQEPE
jgi:putative pre-16S rRNA nuclease